MTGDQAALRRELGRRLRQLRQQRDLSIEAVAGEVMCSASKISRLETGTGVPMLRDVRDLCGLYSVADHEAADLMSLARQAQSRPRKPSASENLAAAASVILDSSVRFIQGATDATPVGDPYLPGYLSDLGQLLEARFRASGDPADLDAAIVAAQQAAEEAPTGDLDLPGYLSNLAFYLLIRFNIAGDIKDIDAAIDKAQQAAAAASPDCPERVIVLANLRDALSARYEKRRDDGDLDAAIAVGQEAVQVAAARQDPQLLSSMSRLRDSLAERFVFTDDSDDLDGALSAAWQIVSAWQEIADSATQDHPGLLGFLFNLGTAQHACFRLAGDPDALDAAIVTCQKAVVLVEAELGNPYNQVFLSTVASFLLERFRLAGNGQDLAAAVAAAQNAVDRTPPSHPDRESRESILRECLDAQSTLGWSPWTNGRPERSVASDRPFPLRTSLQVTQLMLLQPGGVHHKSALHLPLEARGIVVTSTIRRNLRSYSISADSKSLRTMALYWDHIIWAYGNGIGIRKEEGIKHISPMSVEASVLEKEGFLTLIRRDFDHPDWDPDGPSVANNRFMGIDLEDHISLAIARLQILARELNESRTKGTWSAGRTLLGSSLIGLPHQAPDRESLAIQLTMSLPVPPEDVPIDKILMFREKHRDSLFALRRGIRALCEAPNTNLTDQLADVEVNLSTIDRLLAESFIQKWARRVNVVLGLEDVRKSAILVALGELAGLSLKLPQGLGPTIGLGVSGALNLAQKRVPAEYTLPDRVSDFYYVYAAARLRK
jgi:transcriptional regulator with XRE-family HTH domain